MLTNTIKGLLAEAEKTGYGPTISDPLKAILLVIGAAIDGIGIAAAQQITGTSPEHLDAQAVKDFERLISAAGGIATKGDGQAITAATTSVPSAPAQTVASAEAVAAGTAAAAAVDSPSAPVAE